MRYKLWHIGRKEYVHWPHGRMWIAKGSMHFAELLVFLRHADRHYGGTNSLRHLQVHSENGEILNVHPTVHI